MLLDLGAHHLFIASREDDEDDRYDQWIFFDDVWASGNAAYHKALVAYAWRWNVLSD